MSEANGHRWSKFWWQDWQNDHALKACSLAAQGLWMQLLCIMNAATPRGYLLLNGKPPTAKQLATIIGATLKEIAALLAELRDAGVYSHDTTGIIYSRRMVRDTAATEHGQRTGKLGGNPHLKRRTNGAHPTKGVNPPPYPNPLSGGLNLQEAEAESEAENPPNPPCQGGLPGEVIRLDNRKARRERPPSNPAAALIARRLAEKDSLDALLSTAQIEQPDPGSAYRPAVPEAG